MSNHDNAEAFKRILPFLREIEHLILDDIVSEIMVNSSTHVFAGKRGFVERIPDIRMSQEKPQVTVQNIPRHLGDDISPEKPILDSRLPDGSRIAAVLPPCSVQGITLTIRKFNTRSFTMADLIAIDTVEETSAALL